MKALVLAAGFGTRLKPLTDSIPKPLVPVNGIPMILYNLALLKHHGITDIVINLHYLGGKIRKFLGNGKKLGLRIRYSDEPEILGTGGGIRKVLPYLADDENILVINGDIITDLNLNKLILQHQKSQALATLVLRDHADKKHFGKLGYQKDQLVSILGQPKLSRSASSGHFTGIHILQKEPLRALPLKTQTCIIQDYYIPKLKTGEKLSAFVMKGYWNDCGTLAALQKTGNLLAKNQVKLSYRKALKEMCAGLIDHGAVPQGGN